MDAISPVEQFREHLGRAGITAEKPLYAVLLTVYETSLRASEIVGKGARGLSPEGERELIHRVAENAVSVTEQQLERLALKVSFRTAGLFGLAGLVLVVVGYAWGYWQGMHSLAG